MKKTLFIVGLFTAMSVNAQGRRDGQSAIHANYGFPLGKKGNQSEMMVKAGYSRTFGDKGILGKAEFFYKTYGVSYIDSNPLPYQMYGVNVNAGYSFEKLQYVYLTAYAGLYGGFEVVNKNNPKEPTHGQTINGELRGFRYGISASAEVEVPVIRNFSIIADYTQFFNLTSKFSKAIGTVNGGVKYYF